MDIFKDIYRTTKNYRYPDLQKVIIKGTCCDQYLGVISPLIIDDNEDHLKNQLGPHQSQ